MFLLVGGDEDIILVLAFLLRAVLRASKEGREVIIL